jgi:oxygen-independent coproporphyrinogen-3 oxidase
VIHEASLVAAQKAVQGRVLKYVYFGGGTPSFLSVKQLQRLVAGLHESFGWNEAEEVTFECEPGTLSEPKIMALKQLGVTRISLGVENFNDSILESNGRAHLSNEIFRAWDWIEKAGFPSTNIDLIAGMVGETTESWQETVETALKLTPDSLTIYQMELPYNTVFVKSSKDNGEATAVADWPTKRAWVDWAFNRFVKAGYSISSAYTLVRDSKNVEFRYRDMLWEGSDLVALGVASFGHLSGIHYQNKTHWDDYLAAIDAEQLPFVRGLVAEPRELLIRELVLGLKKGSVDTARLRTKFGVDPLIEWSEIWSQLCEKGFLKPIETSNSPTLTRQGLLQVDSLLHQFFDK